MNIDSGEFAQSAKQFDFLFEYLNYSKKHYNLQAVYGLVCVVNKISATFDAWRILDDSPWLASSRECLACYVAPQLQCLALA